MQIHLIAVGKIKEPFLRDGIEEYLRRLSGFVTIRITDFSEERAREGASAHEILTACKVEGDHLLSASGKSDLIIALDPVGKQMGSEELAKLIRGWEIDGPHKISILIGGPHGLSGEVRGRSDLLLSLSPMTFPHQMVRLLILEQLYRAYTINRGIPYHR
ncbi:MAG TPA: 23S rRNA (pseudouridine(1915)-N(3))-methyltransferase RlmH [Methanospirillum sp.]|nr:23S rRNA (pseudouridine(1915)-N(3))-methyltransferase RlmH [Methanospirillum sp.]